MQFVSGVQQPGSLRNAVPRRKKGHKRAWQRTAGKQK